MLPVRLEFKKKCLTRYRQLTYGSLLKNNHTANSMRGTKAARNTVPKILYSYFDILNQSLPEPVINYRYRNKHLHHYIGMYVGSGTSIQSKSEIENLQCLLCINLR
jgi:hypothetical protein